MGIALIGFMGSGKSTVGQRLAERLAWPFVDLDDLIEAREGRTIPEIFATVGEAGFRAAERRALEVTLASERQVLATGGGCPVQPGALDALRAWGDVVYLEVPLAVLAARVDGGGRPLWDDEVAERYERRRPTYARADLVVDGARPVDEVVDRIVEELGL